MKTIAICVARGVCLPDVGVVYRRVYFFGSLARGHRLHKGSDIDLAVEGLAPGRVYWRALSQLWELT